MAYEEPSNPNPPVETASPEPSKSPEPSESPEESAEPEEEAEETVTPAATPAPTAAPTATPAPTTPANDGCSPKEIAQSYVGGSAAALAGAIGQPNSSEYASSCMGDGEDGIWYYNGFTVYTFRASNGSETVQGVY